VPVKTPSRRSILLKKDQITIGTAWKAAFAIIFQRIAGLSGTYSYGVFVTGLIWGLPFDEDTVTENQPLIDSELKISSFGLDQNNEIDIVDF
jgi:hypothetical protein